MLAGFSVKLSLLGLFTTALAQFNGTYNGTYDLFNATLNGTAIPTNDTAETVLITGAGTGFGYNTTFILARQGYQVIATVQSIHEIQALQQEAIEQNLPIRVEKLDITNEADRIRATNWDVDILVNNAGIAEAGAVIDIPERQLWHQFDVNVISTVLITQKIAREFVKKRSGKIVFISSTTAFNTDPFAGAYSASKRALEGFASALNQELQEFGIQVATVNPGPIYTDFNERMFEEPSYWWPDDQKHAVFDYSKIAFPHPQYPAEPVSELIAAVVNGSVTSYRNIAPPSITNQTRQRFDSGWSQEINSEATTASLVQSAYSAEPTATLTDA